MSVADSSNPKNPGLKELKDATTLGDVAELLGYKPRTLSYLLYKRSDAAKYASFEIPKRAGGVRTISAPIDELKLLQQRLSNLILDCLDEIDVSRGFRTGTSHGFERGRSIITNALEHRNRRFVFNIDLENFFGSIHYGRVIGFLKADRNFKLPERTAKVLAGIACNDNGLPQGSPCSPVFANLIARVLDARLRVIASANKCTYTRYADDITFSTNLRTFPEELAVQVDSESNEWESSADLVSLINRCGFSINASKTRMQYRDSRQEVTGLIVNTRVNVPTEYRKTVRAMVHSLVTKGFFTKKSIKRDAEGKLLVQADAGTFDQLQGMLGFINQVDTNAQRKLGGQNIVSTITSELMYRRFLIYKWFYAASIPTIICEGITDNIYLQHAIRSRAKQFPEFVSDPADGPVKLKVRFFRYPRGTDRETTSTGRILGLTGGSGDLGNLALKYRDTIEGFHPLTNSNPVILLLDNDEGLGTALSKVRQITGVHQDRDEEFIHVVGNLYLVATHRADKKRHSKIEDFFHPDVKADLENRKFNDWGDPDPATEYGKVEFATRVVRAKADTIDFSGFDGLLTTFRKVIQHRAQYLVRKV